MGYLPFGKVGIQLEYRAGGKGSILVMSKVPIFRISNKNIFFFSKNGMSIVVYCSEVMSILWKYEYWYIILGNDEFLYFFLIIPK